MVDRDHADVLVVRQCELLSISRSSVYYSPIETSDYELELMSRPRTDRVHSGHKVYPYLLIDLQKKQNQKIVSFKIVAFQNSSKKSVNTTAEV
jgi:hypothetical protein